MPPRFESTRSCSPRLLFLRVGVPGGRGDDPRRLHSPLAILVKF